MLLGTFYTHPRFDNWNLVALSIEKALEDCENLIILGDFNENMNDDRNCTNIRSIMNAFGLNQLIDTPTRITDTTST